MGLIKAAKSAIKETFGDQFLTAISCEDMGNDILMVKKTNENGIIAKGSRIIVEPGQVALLLDNGKVLDATAEAGVYEFDESSSPSFFAGDFGPVFKEMWERFKFGGADAKEQAVYFFNTKEILDNKFGTPAPIPFQDWSHPIPNQMTNTISPMRVEIKCFGKYTFKIANPALFMSTLAGNVDVYRKDMVVEQLRTEVISVFQNITNELGSEKHKVPVLEMPSYTDEIKQMMDEKVYDEKIRERGLEIVCFAVESVTLDEESEEKIDKYELNSNSFMQQGRMTEAYANAIENAASNEAGSLNGFMGIGIANMATGNAFGGVTNMGHNTNSEPQSNVNTWECSCGAKNTSKFCSECGKPKELKCEKCGKINSNNAKFCSECGEKLQ